jgi:hypothetical protein
MSVLATTPDYLSKSPTLPGLQLIVIIIPLSAHHSFPISKIKNPGLLSGACGIAIPMGQLMSGSLFPTKTRVKNRKKIGVINDLLPF